ncbi:MAG: 4Fe-4S dicluster domain-containing protein [Erysipelotrichaceae bacterium]|nr:4Fe-4S dicluster domain-containing protein [Erysipelotrichaceae bacterium]
MPRVEIRNDLCKSCRYCVRVCPKKCLEIGKTTNAKGYLHVVQVRPEDCIGCAMCAIICPDSVIEVYK